MNLAVGALFLWLGSGFLYLASHGLQAGTPWGAYKTILSKAAGPADDGEGGSDGG